MCPENKFGREMAGFAFRFRFSVAIRATQGPKANLSEPFPFRVELTVRNGLSGANTPTAAKRRVKRATRAANERCPAFESPLTNRHLSRRGNCHMTSHARACQGRHASQRGPGRTSKLPGQFGGYPRKPAGSLARLGPCVPAGVVRRSQGFRSTTVALTAATNESKSEKRLTVSTSCGVSCASAIMRARSSARRTPSCSREAYRDASVLRGGGSGLRNARRWRLCAVAADARMRAHTRALCCGVRCTFSSFDMAVRARFKRLSATNCTDRYNTRTANGVRYGVRNNNEASLAGDVLVTLYIWAMGYHR